MDKIKSPYITKSPYIPGPDILYCNNSCVTRPVQLDFGEADMLPAGTPINPDGQVANDVTALGILLYDTYKGFGSGRALLLIGGHVKLDVVQEHSGITLSSEAKSALKSIVFVGDTEVPSGGSGGGVFTVNFTHDGETDTADKTFEEIKAAYESGQTVIGIADIGSTIILNLTYISTYIFAFCAFWEEGSAVGFCQYAISSEGQITLTMKQLATATS